jgi:hypothetical protein
MCHLITNHLALSGIAESFGLGALSRTQSAAQLGANHDPYVGLIAAELVRLHEGLSSMGRLRRFLIEHPGFIWLLGFPLAPAPETALGFNPQTEGRTTQDWPRNNRDAPL